MSADDTVFDNSTTVGNLLNRNRVGLRFVARAAGVGPNTVKRALDKEDFVRCHHIQLQAVRQAVEGLLRAFRWNGEPCDLWDEFDAIERALLEKEHAA